MTDSVTESALTLNDREGDHVKVCEGVFNCLQAVIESVFSKVIRDRNTFLSVPL